MWTTPRAHRTAVSFLLVLFGCADRESTLAPLAPKDASRFNNVVTGQEARLTTTSGIWATPAISGTRVVYSGNVGQNRDIYLYDLASHTQTRITTDAAVQEDPSISGNRIVWEDWRHPSTQVYLYDLGASNPTEVQLTNTSPGSNSFPAISGMRIAYNTNRNSRADVYTYDLVAGTETLAGVCGSILGGANDPEVSGDRIVFTYRNADVCLYDAALNGNTPITNDGVATFQFNPAISGNRIVYEDTRHGNREIYLYDLTTQQDTRITNNAANQVNPAISGDRIVWEDYRHGHADIYLYDLSTGTATRITTNASFQAMPAIDGDCIVWQDARHGGADIYAYCLAPTNQAPTADAGGPYTGMEGASVSFDASGSSDPEGGALTYEWSFDDGATATGASPQHAYVDDGTYNVTLKVTDPAGASHTASTTAKIENVAPSVGAGPDVTLASGQSFTLAGSFTDPGSQDDPWSYSVSWGTGSPTAGSTNTQSIPSLTSPVYATPGIYTVTLTVMDEDGSSGSDQLVVTVGNQPPVAGHGGPYVGTEGGALTFDGGTSTDPEGQALTYAWDFGDGTTATGAKPQHTYADNGTFEVTLTVTDPFGASSTVKTTAGIDNVAPTTTFSAGGGGGPSTHLPVEGETVLLTMVDPSTDPSSVDVAAAFQYAFDCGFGYGAFAPPTNPGAYATKQCLFEDDGILTLRGNVRDKDGGTTEYTSTITVHNVAPAVTITVTSALPLIQGEAFTATGSFGDPGIKDTWTATVDYASGGQPLALNGMGFTLQRVYPVPGSYAMQVTVTDDDGGVGTESVGVVVLTYGQAAYVLVSQTPTMVRGSSLTQGQIAALQATLAAAAQQLDKGNYFAARNQLVAFMQQVQALINSGKLSKAEGQALIDEAKRLLQLIP